jgi:hypothetical protein
MNAKQWRRRNVQAREAAREERERLVRERRERFGVEANAAVRAQARGIWEAFRATEGWAWAAGYPPPDHPVAVWAKFADGSESQTALLVMRAADHVPAERIRMGGELAAVHASPLALAARDVWEGEHTAEYRMCTWEPFVMSGPDGRMYVMEAFSRFFRCGNVRASDLVEGSARQAQLDEWRKGHYEVNEIGDDDIVIVEMGALEFVH